MLNVLFVASEGLPYIKTGGLADVVGALSKEIHSKDLTVDCLLPKYSQIKQVTDVVYSFSVLFGGVSFPVNIYKKEGNVNTYFVDNCHFFDREAPIYGHFDDVYRFAFFNLAVLEFIKLRHYNIVHTHDWQTGIIPHLIKLNKLPIKTVFTIHNIAYQGVTDLKLHQTLNIPYDSIFEMYSKFNFLKLAIMSSDVITTVSPTYSKEILTDVQGYGLNGVLQLKQNVLYGILNGVDYSLFDPDKDKLINCNYNRKTYNKGKVECKSYLQKKMTLPQKQVAVFGVVSRLAEQKGVDLMLDSLNAMLKKYDFQVVVVGSGDKYYEDAFQKLMDAFPKKVSIVLGYNESLAHQVYAGSDFFIMPSLFEPCGLAQLISLRYGTLPIVRATGGLIDTVKSHLYDGTGFVFEHYDGYGLSWSIEEALLVYNNPSLKKQMISKAMKENFSWKKSAKKYIELYKEV